MVYPPIGVLGEKLCFSASSSELFCARKIDLERRLLSRQEKESTAPGDTARPKHRKTRSRDATDLDRCRAQAYA